MQKNYEILSPIILNFLCIPLYSQTLTIDETIKYLNNLSVKNPFTTTWPDEPGSSDPGCDYSSYYKFFITEEGLINVFEVGTNTNCRINSDNGTGEIKYRTFNVNDVDIDDAELKINCNGKDIGIDCITGYSIRDHREVKYKYRSLGFLISSDKHIIERFRNTLSYLITSGKEKYPRKYDKDDPFASSTDSLTKKMKSATEYKISFKENSGVFSISVNINGVLLNFILDSGAGESNISAETESKLLNKGVIRQKDYLDSGLYKLADGSITECKRVKIPKINVGGKIIYNVIASIGPAGSPNLLGQSFLNKINMWTIDNAKKCLIIR